MPQLKKGIIVYSRGTTPINPFPQNYTECERIFVLVENSRAVKICITIWHAIKIQGILRENTCVSLVHVNQINWHMKYKNNKRKFMKIELTSCRASDTQ